MIINLELDIETNPWINVEFSLDMESNFLYMESH